MKIALLEIDDDHFDVLLDDEIVGFVGRSRDGWIARLYNSPDLINRTFFTKNGAVAAIKMKTRPVL